MPKINSTNPATPWLLRFLFTTALIFAPAAPRAAAAQDRRPRAATVFPAGEVVVVLGEQTFNALVEALFALPQPPTFPLTRGGGAAAERREGECASEITLAREVGGARTSVRFERGRVGAPVAFRGSYDAPVVGCLKFQGWADTQLDLAFDPSKQALAARVEVKKVNLSGVPSLVSDGITSLVQKALDERVNPVEILRAEQISAALPLRRLQTGGSLRLRAREVRHEVLPGELRLRIAYEFVHED